MSLKEELLKTDYYIDNEYLDKYIEIVEKNKSIDLNIKDRDKHHIIPEH